MKVDNNRKYFKKFSHRKVLIVGGSGFIGQALAKRLLSLKAAVFSLSRTENRTALMPFGVLCKVADLRDKSGLTRVIGGEKFDYVINAGGYIDHAKYLEGGRQVINTHYVGTLNLLDLVYQPGLKRFIQIGSSDEYGNSPAPQREDMREAAIAPYSAAKVATTNLLQTLARSEGFPGVVVRLFLVYGPGQYEARFLPFVINGCLQNVAFPTSQGEQLRDFCYIEDVVEGLLLSAVKKEAIGQVINIASGKPISIRNVIMKVVELIGGGNPTFGAHSYRSGENMALYANIQKAGTILNWGPTTLLDEGLKKTIVWYSHRHS